jgi:hypothetical protein
MWSPGGPLIRTSLRNSMCVRLDYLICIKFNGGMRRQRKMLQYIFAGEGHSTVKVNNKYGSHALTRYLISTKHATQL